MNTNTPHTPAEKLRDELNALRGGPMSGQHLAYDAQGPGTIYTDGERPGCATVRIPWANQPAMSLARAEYLIDCAEAPRCSIAGFS